ncbi:hypothetical protein, partial [Gloeocapsa sp. PCC 73106]|uniref:hypothetical protein n=1 Tax=Gloeocapsa sp. PCC 73106 TaxID=102232 RepID=UPI0002ABDD9D
MSFDKEIYHHQEWLGLIQPVGLVVAPPALVRAQAYIDSAYTIELQQRLLNLISIREGVAVIEDFP